jgi:hypothetical protein
VEDLTGGSEVTGLDLLTLGIAVLGFVVAVASLVWQMVAWRAEGARVRVEVRSAFGVMMTGELGDHLLAVEALNVGRAAVELVGWGFDLGGDRSIPDMRPMPMSTPLPHTLAGGHKATFYMPAVPVRATIREQGAAGRARAFVSLGNGKRVLSERLRDV